MRRLGSAIVIASLALVLLPATPARAASVWDPDDPIYRLDIRWVGAYEQADGRIRLTISFHHRVRLRWFEPLQMGTFSTLVVSFSADRNQEAFTFALFGRENGRLVAAMCEDQEGCGRGLLRRPNRRTIRAWFDPGALTPHAGWAFRARSWRHSGGVDPLDRTAWGMVT
jgi:hypothetical protein